MSDIIREERYYGMDAKIRLEQLLNAMNNDMDKTTMNFDGKATFRFQTNGDDFCQAIDYYEMELHVITFFTKNFGLTAPYRIGANTNYKALNMEGFEEYSITFYPAGEDAMGYEIRAMDGFVDSVLNNFIECYRKINLIMWGQETGEIYSFDAHDDSENEYGYEMTVRNSNDGEKAELIKANKTKNKIDWYNPEKIVEHLDNFVISHEKAKIDIAVPMSNFVVCANNRLKIPSNAMIIVGPTGSGKTEIGQRIFNYLDLPKVKFNATGKSTAGLVGENVGTIFERLLPQIDPKDNAPYALFWIDEIDKICLPSKSGDMGRGIQNEILGWMQDATVYVKDEMGGKREISTKNIKFLCSGAFSGEKGGAPSIYKNRENKLGLNTPGFKSDEKNKREEMKDITAADLIGYGMIAELAGRLTVITELKPLSKESLAKILTDSKDSFFKHHVDVLKARRYEVIIDEVPVAKYIANLCPEDTGARALRSLVSAIFTKIEFSPKLYADNNRIIRVTKRLAKELIESKPLKIAEKKKRAIAVTNEQSQN